jgi:PTS hybrid protein
MPRKRSRMVEPTVARVGLVFVSHSDLIARGLTDLAAQMAPSVTLRPAGGTDGGEIGTSYRKVAAGLLAAESGAGVVVICDLGSAMMIAETARDAVEGEARDRILIVDAPLIEGGVAAAVAAEFGASLQAVAKAATAGLPGPSSQSASAAEGPGAGPAHRFARSVVILNDEGLHARPAAEFVKLANSFPVKVTVNGKDAKSLLGIMSLGLTKGASAEIVSVDPAGEVPVNALADLVESGFEKST